MKNAGFNSCIHECRYVPTALNRIEHLYLYSMVPVEFLRAFRTIIQNRQIEPSAVQYIFGRRLGHVSSITSNFYHCIVQMCIVHPLARILPCFGMRWKSQIKKPLNSTGQLPLSVPFQYRFSFSLTFIDSIFCSFLYCGQLGVLPSSLLQ